MWLMSFWDGFKDDDEGGKGKMRKDGFDTRCSGLTGYSRWLKAGFYG